MGLEAGKLAYIKNLNGPEWATYQALMAAADKSAGQSWDAANLAQYQHDLAASWSTPTPGQNVPFTPPAVYPGVDDLALPWGDNIGSVP
jgi:hypothetical protein